MARGLKRQSRASSIRPAPSRILFSSFRSRFGCLARRTNTYRSLTRRRRPCRGADSKTCSDDRLYVTVRAMTKSRAAIFQFSIQIRMCRLPAGYHRHDYCFTSNPASSNESAEGLICSNSSTKLAIESGHVHSVDRFRVKFSSGMSSCSILHEKDLAFPPVSVTDLQVIRHPDRGADAMSSC